VNTRDTTPPDEVTPARSTHPTGAPTTAGTLAVPAGTTDTTTDADTPATDDDAVTGPDQPPTATGRVDTCTPNPDADASTRSVNPAEFPENPEPAPTPVTATNKRREPIVRPPPGDRRVS
jgi:hypothetical protein